MQSFVTDRDAIIGALAQVIDPELRRSVTELEMVRDVADSISAGEFEATPGWACRTCDFNMICPAQDR